MVLHVLLAVLVVLVLVSSVSGTSSPQTDHLPARTMRAVRRWKGVPEQRRAGVGGANAASGSSTCT